MALLIQVLATKLTKLLLIFQAKSSFEVTTIYKEITPIGWLVVIVLSLALIFRIVFLIVKMLKKPKLK